MQTVTDMALPHLAVEDPAFWADPLAAITVARGQHPWLATTNYGYFVHGYQAIKDIVYMDDKLRPNFEDLVAYLKSLE